MTEESIRDGILRCYHDAFREAAWEVHFDVHRVVPDLAASLDASPTAVQREHNRLVRKGLLDSPPNSRTTHALSPAGLEAVEERDGGTVLATDAVETLRETLAAFERDHPGEYADPDEAFESVGEGAVARRAYWYLWKRGEVDATGRKDPEGVRLAWPRAESES
ncbi:hypothetical protein [Halomarina ordinaria]|uniref:Uncharacterized protein n=1 Tax=Halomarina ordinaria TaxID=3033939 RepID=A0ABD5UAY3_9EURY|nr:hypothetical protein [Halomarina sp. PSRA2]